MSEETLVKSFESFTDIYLVTRTCWSGDIVATVVVVVVSPPVPDVVTV